MHKNVRKRLFEFTILTHSLNKILFMSSIFRPTSVHFLLHSRFTSKLCKVFWIIWGNFLLLIRCSFQTSYGGAVWKMISGYLSSSAKVIFGTFVLFLVNIIWVLSSEISHVSTPSIFFTVF